MVVERWSFPGLQRMAAVRLHDAQILKKVIYLFIINTLEPHYNTDFGVHGVISVTTE